MRAGCGAGAAAGKASQEPATGAAGSKGKAQGVLVVTVAPEGALMAAAEAPKRRGQRVQLVSFDAGSTPDSGVFSF